MMHPAIHASFFSSLLLMLTLIAPYAATFMIGAQRYVDVPVLSQYRRGVM